jgi:hypothetical protein
MSISPGASPKAVPDADDYVVVNAIAANVARVTDASSLKGDGRGHWLEMIFLLGLAGVFLANAAVGWLEPAGFVKLTEDSRIGAWLRLGDAPWLVPLVCLNDLVVGLGGLAAIWSRRAPQRLILAWAGVWLRAVTLLKLTALDVVGSL